MIGPQCCIEAGDLRGLFWPQGGAAQVASKQTRKKSTFCLFFYRTHVHMGSDHWVAMSHTFCETFLKLCEDLVKTVNVVNVVKI